jgi:hypothetical protein
MTDDRFLSRQEAAIKLGVAVAVVDRLIATGLLLRYRVAGRWVRVEAGQVAELATLPREYLLRC